MGRRLRSALAALVFTFSLFPFPFAAEPRLTAHWTGPRAAVVAWQSDAQLVCLYRETREGWGYALGCASGGSGELQLPRRDFAYKVFPGDRFCADFDSLPRVCTAPLPWRVWAAWAGNGVERSRVFAPLVVG